MSVLARGFLCGLMTAVSCVWARSLAAQCVFPVSPGSYVRIDAPSLGLRAHVGILARANCDTILVARDGGRLAVAVRDLTELEVPIERRSKALLGAGLGLVAGAAPPLIKLAGCGDAYTSGVFTCEGKALVLGLVTVPLGVLLGAGIGALLGTDSWVPVDLDRPVVGLAPYVDRLALQFTVSFRL